MTEVRLFPVRVQGAESPGEIAAAIRYANHYGLADLLIVGRGGGSIEDLWAFNEEIVAHAIYDSGIPVISAVGHEPDVTISDFVADLRAATPSNAAELAVPDRDALEQSLDAMVSSIAASLDRMLKASRKQLQTLLASPVLHKPDSYLEQKGKDLRMLENRLVSAQSQILARSRQRYVGSVAKLDAMSPLKVLSRGYSVVRNSENQILRSTSDVQIGENLTITLSEGQLYAEVTRKEDKHESEEQDF